MEQVVLGLGSNKNFKDMSSLDILKKACLELKQVLENITYSSVYRTKAMYVTDQNDFYNMVVSGFVADSVNPHELLKTINNIEAKYGRDRSKEIRFGPRSLDIDIEAFGDEKINDSLLTIPHPRIKERAFVLIPALEIFTKSADNIKRESVEKWLKNIPASEKELEVILTPEKLFDL